VFELGAFSFRGHVRQVVFEEPAEPPRPSRMMTDAEIEDEKTALLMDLAKLYNTTTDLLHVQTWTDGNDTLVMSSVTQAQLSTTYIVRLSSTPMVGSTSTSASVIPTYFAVDGYNGQPFLCFSKTSVTTGNQYLTVSGPRRSSDQL
jgi:hypothetical protein